MNIKPYGKGMLLVAIPATFFGALFAFVTTHSGGALFYFSFTLVPGLWFVDKFGFTDNEYVWPIALLVQILYWSVVVTIFNIFRTKK